jgi:hypothetical protein
MEAERRSQTITNQPHPGERQGVVESMVLRSPNCQRSVGQSLALGGDSSKVLFRQVGIWQFKLEENCKSAQSSPASPVLSTPSRWSALFLNRGKFVLGFDQGELLAAFDAGPMTDIADC